MNKGIFNALFNIISSGIEVAVIDIVNARIVPIGKPCLTKTRITGKAAAILI